MSRIREALQGHKSFIGFLTAGDPCIEKTEEFILEMVRAGVDLVEIGVPFSDPIAEGVVIQEADLRALKAGTTIGKIFDMVVRLREKTQVPFVFLTYANPVYHYGYEAFMKKCREVGMDGIIIPDIPFEEKHEVSDIADKYGIDVISMIAPTSEQRIRKIAREAKGFLYVVSSLGVTGVRSEFTTDLESIVETAREETDVPCAIGFGIHTPDQAKKIAVYADGAIVGSAIVKIIAQYGDEAGAHLYEYVKSMKEAVSGSC